MDASRLSFRPVQEKKIGVCSSTPGRQKERWVPGNPLQPCDSTEASPLKPPPFAQEPMESRQLVNFIRGHVLTPETLYPRHDALIRRTEAHKAIWDSTSLDSIWLCVLTKRQWMDDVKRLPTPTCCNTTAIFQPSLCLSSPPSVRSIVEYSTIIAFQIGEPPSKSESQR